jgi:hypothetical protein
LEYLITKIHKKAKSPNFVYMCTVCPLAYTKLLIFIFLLRLFVMI